MKTDASNICAGVGGDVGADGGHEAKVHVLLWTPTKRLSSA
jgi:hypothetical protein